MATTTAVYKVVQNISKRFVSNQVMIQCLYCFASILSASAIILGLSSKFSLGSASGTGVDGAEDLLDMEGNRHFEKYLYLNVDYKHCAIKSLPFIAVVYFIYSMYCIFDIRFPGHTFCIRLTVCTRALSVSVDASSIYSSKI